MKSEGKLSKVKFTIVIAAILFAVCVLNITFGKPKNTDIKASDVKSMINAINSENSGLAQSSIYLAGYYGFKWAVDPLINILNNSSKETRIGIMAAYSLFMIGDEKGMLAIKAASSIETNHILKGTCELICNKYLTCQPQPVALH